SIAVPKIRAAVVQAFDDTPEDLTEGAKAGTNPDVRCDRAFNWIEFDLQPLVVKQSEIVVLPLVPKRDREIDLMGRNLKRQMPYAALCILFDLVTPSSVETTKAVPVYERIFFRGGQPGHPDWTGPTIEKGLLELNKPHPLVKWTFGFLG